MRDYKISDRFIVRHKIMFWSANYSVCVVYTKTLVSVKVMENCYCSEEDVLKLSCLPTIENTQLNLLKLGHHAFYNNNWPEYLTLFRHNPSRT